MQRRKSFNKNETNIAWDLKNKFTIKEIKYLSQKNIHQKFENNTFIKE